MVPAFLAGAKLRNSFFTVSVNGNKKTSRRPYLWNGRSLWRKISLGQASRTWALLCNNANESDAALVQKNPQENPDKGHRGSRPMSVLRKQSVRVLENGSYFPHHTRSRATLSIILSMAIATFACSSLCSPIPHLRPCNHWYHAQYEYGRFVARPRKEMQESAPPLDLRASPPPPKLRRRLFPASCGRVESVCLRRRHG